MLKLRHMSMNYYFIFILYETILSKHNNETSRNPFMISSKLIYNSFLKIINSHWHIPTFSFLSSLTFKIDIFHYKSKEFLILPSELYLLMIFSFLLRICTKELTSLSILFWILNKAILNSDKQTWKLFSSLLVQTFRLYSLNYPQIFIFLLYSPIIFIPDKDKVYFFSIITNNKRADLFKIEYTVFLKIGFILNNSFSRFFEEFTVHFMIIFFKTILLHIKNIISWAFYIFFVFFLFFRFLIEKILIKYFSLFSNYYWVLN